MPLKYIDDVYVYKSSRPVEFARPGKPDCKILHPLSEALALLGNPIEDPFNHIKTIECCDGKGGFRAALN